jgi:hypothetical protein
MSERGHTDVALEFEDLWFGEYWHPTSADVETGMPHSSFVAACIDRVDIRGILRVESQVMDAYQKLRTVHRENIGPINGSLPQHFNESDGLLRIVLDTRTETLNAKYNAPQDYEVDRFNSLLEFMAEMQLYDGARAVISNGKGICVKREIYYAFSSRHGQYVAVPSNDVADIDAHDTAPQTRIFPVMECGRTYRSLSLLGKLTLRRMNASIVRQADLQGF